MGGSSRKSQVAHRASGRRPLRCRRCSTTTRTPASNRSPTRPMPPSPALTRSSPRPSRPHPPSRGPSCPSSWPGPSSCARTGAAPSWARSTPMPPCATRGTEAEERLNKWRVAVVFRSDLFEAVRAFAATDEAQQLTGERRRLLEFWLRDFRRAGHELTAEDRAELERLRTRLVEVEVAFQRNVNEYRDGIDVTREQLAGLPDVVRRAAVARRNAKHLSGQPRLPGAQPVPRPGTGPRAPAGAVHEVLEPGGRREQAAARRGARPAQADRGHARRADLGPLRHGAEDGGQPGARADVLRGAAAVAGRDRGRRAGSARCTPHRRRRGRADHGLGLALLRRRSAAHRVRRRPGRDRRVPPARPDRRGHVRDHGRGVRPRVPRRARGARLARFRPALRDPRQGLRQEPRALLRRPLPARGQVRARGGLPARRRPSRRPMASTWRR